MKIRKAFVSNSSSSSYILGYGVIKDIELLRRSITEIEKKIGRKISDWEVRIVAPGHYNYKEDYDFQPLSRSNNVEVRIPTEIRDKNLLILEIGNDEGDSAFWNPASEELEWENADDLSWFDQWQQEMVEILTDPDIIDQDNMHVEWGAERNG